VFLTGTGLSTSKWGLGVTLRQVDHLPPKQTTCPSTQEWALNAKILYVRFASVAVILPQTRRLAALGHKRPFRKVSMCRT